MISLPSYAQGTSSGAALVLPMLLEQQASLSAQAALAEQQLREAQVKFEMAGGADKLHAHAPVVQAEVRAADARQRLNMINERVLDAQRALSTDSRSGIAIAQEQNTIFTLKPAEFYSTLGFVLWLPVFLAVARRIWRGGTIRKRQDEALVGNPQITRLEQAVESIAIEVERIGEAQRFSAKLLAERPVERVKEGVSPRRIKRPVITPVP